MVVFGGNNVGFYPSVKSMLDSKKKFTNENMSYECLNDNWFVISYIKNNDIYYEKSYWGPGSTNTLLIHYPVSLKEKYDKLISILAASFNPGNLNVAQWFHIPLLFVCGTCC